MFKSILNPMADSRGAARSNTVRGSMKKPLMGSVTSARSTARPMRVASPDRLARRLSHAPSPPASDVAAADHDIQRLGPQGVQHAGQQGLVVLQVAVQGGDVGGKAALRAFDERRRQAAPGRAMDQADAAVLPAQGHNRGACAVGGTVIDEYGLPRQTVQREAQAVHEGRDVVALVQDGDDDA